VIARHQALKRERGDLESGDERIADLEREAAAARAAYVAAAQTLSTARRRAARDFATRLEALLAELAMAETRFEVRFGEPVAEPDWGAHGFDAAEFYVSPNPGET